MKPASPTQAQPDPRGIRRHIVAIDPQPEATYLTLSCSHRNPMAQHFAYRAGDDIHCFQCGLDARAALAVSP